MQKRECVDKDLTCKPHILNQNVVLVQYHAYFQGFATHRSKVNICIQKYLEHLTFANL